MRKTNSTARLRSLARIAAQLLRELGAAARRGFVAWMRYEHARATYTALHALDARTLRDLGIDRSEALLIAEGMARGGDPTRVLSVHGRRGPSR